MKDHSDESPLIEPVFNKEGGFQSGGSCCPVAFILPVESLVSILNKCKK